MDPTLPPSAESQRAGRDDERVPGLVVVFLGGGPTARVVEPALGRIELGRGDDGAGKIDDGRVSRQHALVEIDGAHCMVTDLGSQNGTFVDGEPAVPHVPTPAQRVIRIGDSLLVPRADVRPIARAGVCLVDGFVRGAAMQVVLEDAAAAARSASTLHIRGESGCGKEGVAQAFHRAGARGAAALVAVNCAAIPHAIAERLLFGARRGAYSGAEADAAGYVQEADGGTLFLDEIGELDAQVQAKLLRVLESREVLPLGASKPRKVDFALCSATNRDLRALVAAGGFREDLYFRITGRAVMLPALRNRPEEIPALIAQELAKLSPSLKMRALFVEQCLLRPWPGNVRELLAEVRNAGQAALSEGRRLAVRHLSATAGSVFGSESLGARVTPPAAPGTPAPERPHREPPPLDAAWHRRIAGALQTHAGNVTAAARALGLHRTQLRRLIERHGIAVDAAAATGHDDRSDDPDD